MSDNKGDALPLMFHVILYRCDECFALFIRKPDTEPVPALWTHVVAGMLCGKIVPL